MPLSASVVFDVLRVWAAGEALEVSVRELAEVCRLSPAATWYALRRLRGANLVRWATSGPGRGGRSTFEVLWDRPRTQIRKGAASYPQKNVHPRPMSYARYPTPGVQGFSHTGSRPSCGNPARSKAFRWAMAQVRAEVRAWPITWERRNRVLRGVAVALCQALAKGHAAPGPELGQLVRELIGRLRTAEAISGETRAAVRFGVWAVGRCVCRLDSWPTGTCGSAWRGRADTPPGEQAEEATQGAGEDLQDSWKGYKVAGTDFASEAAERPANRLERKASWEQAMGCGRSAPHG